MNRQEMDELFQKLTPEVISRLKENCNVEPKGILNVSANFGDRTKEGSWLEQYIGVATTNRIEGDFDVLPIEPSIWAVFPVWGRYPEALQKTWADIYAVWLQNSDYSLTGGPEILWNEGPDMGKEDYHSEIRIPVECKQKKVNV